jgi:hypothetical protein
VFRLAGAGTTAERILAIDLLTLLLIGLHGLLRSDDDRLVIVPPAAGDAPASWRGKLSRTARSAR